jgi:hypothetical protein
MKKWKNPAGVLGAISTRSGTGDRRLKKPLEAVLQGATSSATTARRQDPARSHVRSWQKQTSACSKGVPVLTSRPREFHPRGGLSDRAVIDRYVARIIVRPDSIDIELKGPTAASAPSLGTDAPVTAGEPAPSICTFVISLPWSTPVFPFVKGVLHQPEAKPSLKQAATAPMSGITRG